MNWLVAEDETDIRMLITTMIQVWGHSAAAFENGQKVWDWLDKLEAGEGTAPALALMDIRMPGKKGNELAARMRALPTFAQTPIVLMTAYSMTDAERQEIIERDGVDKIIQKPLPEFEQLRQMLHQCIDDRKAAQPHPPAASSGGDPTTLSQPRHSGAEEMGSAVAEHPAPVVPASTAEPVPAPAASLSAEPEKASEPKSS